MESALSNEIEYVPDKVLVCFSDEQKVTLRKDPFLTVYMCQKKDKAKRD